MQLVYKNLCRLGTQGVMPLGRDDTSSYSAQMAVALRPRDTSREQKLRCESQSGPVKLGHGPIKLDILFTHVFTSEFKMHFSSLTGSGSGSPFTLFTFPASVLYCVRVLLLLQLPLRHNDRCYHSFSGWEVFPSAKCTGQLACRDGTLAC